MKTYIKYLCAVVLLIGTSASAWGYTVNIHNTLTGCTEHTGNPTTFESDRITTLSLYYDINDGADPSWPTTYNVKWGASGTNLPDKNKCRWHDDNEDGIYQLDLYFSSNIAAEGSGSDFYITISLESCDDPSASVSLTSKTVSYGADAFNLTASRSGSGTVTWTSSNTSVASLSSTSATGATVTPGRAGTATVTYSVAKNGDYCADEATCEVTVNSRPPTLSHNTSGKAITTASITSTSVTLSKGIITAKGGADITSYGFVVGTSSSVNYGSATKKPQVGTDNIALNTAFGSATITGLTPNTTYYVKAYATNAGPGSNKTGYSDYITFTTLRRDTVVYNNNGGSGSISNLLLDRGETKTLSNGSSFSKTGYTLSKWNTASGGGDTDYAKGASYTSATAKLTLFAIWTPNEYTITLNDNGGSGGDGTHAVTYDAATGSLTNAPTKTGYTFGGYWTNSGGTGTQVFGANLAPIQNVSGYTDNTGDKKWIYNGNKTLYAKWTANEYTITLDGNGATTAGTTSVTATYNLSSLPSITNPEKTEKNFAGWYSGEGGTGSMVISTTGQFKASVDGYTGTGGKWIRTSNTTLYAKWVNEIYTVTYNMHDHGAAPADEEVESGGNLATQPEDPVAEDWRFLGWYKESTYNNVWDFSTQTVTGNTTIHAKWEAVLYDETTYKAWCEPDVTMTENIYLTSTKDVYVQDSSLTNCLRIQSSDLSGVNTLTITYLNASGEVIEKGTCPFRFCQNGKNSWAEITTSIALTENTCDTTFSIKYTPTDYAQSHHNKIRVTMKRGTRELKSVTCDLWGRSLPEEFVIAAKSGNQWYALPNDLASTSGTQGAITPIKIEVDPDGAPTKATYAPENAIYNATDRYQPTKYRAGIRFTTTGLNWLQTAKGTSTSDYPMWLSTSNSDSAQVWYLKTNNLSSYTLKMDPKHNGSKSMGIYTGGSMGFHPSPSTNAIYFLPVDNIYTDYPAVVTEWGKKSVILDVDARTASSVSAHIGDQTPEDAASFGETKTSVVGADSKYNYTLTFSTLDFSANKDSVLYFDWKDGEGNLIGCSQVVIPWIIATSRDMYKDGETTKGPWNTEVHVLPGVTLTANTASYSPSGATIKELHIYPGATVNVTTGTLSVTDLIMRNGWTRAGGKNYDVARLYITPSTGSLAATRAYADWYIDFDQYYPVAVPWSVTTSGMSYKNSNSAASAGVKMRYYDGASRATNGQAGVGDGANWKAFNNGVTPVYPATLTPGVGYAMTARRPTGKAFSIIRMPLTIPSAAWTALGEQGEVSSVYKDKVSVIAHGVGEDKPAYTLGWNFIANPYMAIYQGPITHSEGSDYNVEYVNIPDLEFKNYAQYPVGVDLRKLSPSSGFFIQAAATGTLTFGTTSRKPSAPSYRKEETTPVVSKQKAYIVLNNEGADDMMGLIISEKYTEAYEINADLEKLLGDGNNLKTYMRYGDMNLAYVAINSALAQEWIPVSVQLPEGGEYTFSLHEASVIDELEGVYLIDYAAGNVITNLLDDNYSFGSAPGTISNRFAINAIVGEHNTPTGIDVINGGGDINSDKPFKFIYHEKVYIYHRGVIYDATGKRVREINK